jgi:hypothetical protein
MKKQPPSEPEMPREALLKNLTADFIKIRDALAKCSADMPPARELKYIRSEQDMIEKMPFVEKALQLALENQELFPKDFIDKFWENYDRRMTIEALQDSSNKLMERLLEICPEAAVPYVTEKTTNG